mgnify:CR=1 FL=1
MNRFVIDTNILLYYLRGKETYRRYEQRLQLFDGNKRIFISSVTLGELEGFQARQKWGKAKMQKLRELIADLFVIDVSAAANDLLTAYGTLLAYSKNAHPEKPLGRSIGIGNNDLWIAATAYTLGATLISTDVDFDHLHETFITVMKPE